ncbi:MAG: hypothetical protein ACSLE7_17255 [Mycobacterium sp.]
MTLALDRSPAAESDQSTTMPAPTRRTWLPWAIMALALVLFISSVGSIRGAASVKSQWGLIGTASPLWILSFLCAALAFAVSVRHGNVKAVWAATVVVGITNHLPRAIANDVPMYAWTYKHVGLADYIQQTHSLAHGVDIYQGWPSSFALSAWFAELTGVPVMDYAAWFIPGFHILFGFMVYGAARVWDLSSLVAAAATFMAVSLNWVQQDYFSPQATVMLMLPGIFIVLGLSRNRPVGSMLLVILFATAAITHQLTPFWLFGAIGLLTITRNFHPWWLVIPLGAILVCQLIYNWDEVSRYQLFSGDILDNAKSNITRYGVEPVLGQRIVSYGNKALAGGLWLSTGLVIVYRMWKRQPFWAAAVLALSPMLLLGGQSYGGEAIFRVYLYSVIGCCFVLAPVVVALLQAGVRTYIASTGVILFGVTAALNSETAAWYAYIMPKAQVEESMQVMSQAELPAYLTSAAPTWPERSSWRYVDYATFSPDYDVPMVTVPNLARRTFDNDEDYRVFLEALSTRPDASTYLIITDQTQFYTWYFGILPWEALPNLKQYLRRDTERWEPFYEGEGVSVFVHRVEPAPMPMDPPG